MITQRKNPPLSGDVTKSEAGRSASAPALCRGVGGWPKEDRAAERPRPDSNAGCQWASEMSGFLGVMCPEPTEFGEGHAEHAPAVNGIREMDRNGI